MRSAPLPAEDLETVLLRSASFWEAHRGATVLVTGGTGFIGRWITEAIQHANDALGNEMRLVLLTRDLRSSRRRLPHIFMRRDVEGIEGDVRTFDISDRGIDVCVHGAAAYDDPHSAARPIEVFDTIVEGTRRSLEIAARTDAARYLLLSSGAVYGKQPAEVVGVREDFDGAPSTLRPAAAYGNAKRAAEWLVAAAAERGAPSGSTIARIFSVIGPGMALDRHFAAGSFVRDALAGRSVGVRDGRPERSYIYAADLCTWLLRVLEQGKGGQAYNVGSEQVVSIAALAELVAAAGRTSVDYCGEAGDAALAPSRYVPDTTKAKVDLGLAEYTPMNIAIQKSLAWYRSCLA